MTERCPTCGMDVRNIFEHVDRDCEHDHERLRICMEDVGWSAGSLAELLSVASANVRRWRSGSKPVPDAILLWAIRVRQFIIENPPPPAPPEHET